MAGSAWLKPCPPKTESICEPVLFVKAALFLRTVFSERRRLRLALLYFASLQWQNRGLRADVRQRRSGRLPAGGCGTPMAMENFPSWRSCIRPPAWASEYLNPTARARHRLHSHQPRPAERRKTVAGASKIHGEAKQGRLSRRRSSLRRRPNETLSPIRNRLSGRPHHPR